MKKFFETSVFQVHGWVFPVFSSMYCLGISIQVFLDKNHIKKMIEQHSRVDMESLLSFNPLGSFIVEHLQLSLSLLIVALILTSVPRFRRYCSFFSFFLFFLIFNEYISHRPVNHRSYIPWNHGLVVFNLLTIWLGSFFDKDFRKENLKTSRFDWRVLLIHMNLVFAYFNSSLVKLSNDTWWANGFTLQKYFLGRYLVFEKESILFLVQNFPLLVFIGIGTLFIEITYPLSIFNKKAYVFYGFIGFFTQILFYYLIDLRWMKYFGWSYLIVLLSILSWLMDHFRSPRILRGT